MWCLLCMSILCDAFISIAFTFTFIIYWLHCLYMWLILSVCNYVMTNLVIIMYEII